jgi:hypothetical protein
MSALFDDTEEFNDYLEKQVKSHRMYPSDNIWRNIQSTLHGEYSWRALPVISMFIIAALTAGTLLTKPNNDLPKAQYHPIISASSIAVTEKQSKTSSEILRQHLSPENITQQTISQVSKDMGINEDENIAATYLPVPVEDLSSDLAVIKNQIITPTNFTKINAAASPALFAATKTISNQTHAVDENNSYIKNAIIPENVFSFMRAIPEKQKGGFSMQSSIITSYEFKSPYVRSYIRLNLWRNNDISSINNFHPKAKIPKFSIQVYATPSVSYRRLIDASTGRVAQSFIPAPAQSNYGTDVNQGAHNTPGLGLEAGFAIGYKITDQITLKTGFQFNMRQYNIQAYNYNQPTATNAINSISSNGPDSLNFVSNTGSSSSSGIYTTTLVNRYYEISMPLGIDWKVVSLNKFSVGLAGFVQPTYTFDRQPFIITTNLKNYIDGSSLIRRWNINTSAEAYIAYKIGDYTWQIGPQFRYQQLPSLTAQYPIKEYLLDYGFKIGVTKSIK